MKINIHPLSTFILLGILLCGYFNYFLIISIILICHDLGHLILMKIFNVKIIDIQILPFGSMINTNIKYNLSSTKLFLISIGGILVQLVLYLVFYLLLKFNIISNLSYQIFLTYNKLIIIFNILPIIPLDGSKILLSFLERVFPYKISLKILNYISLLSILLFIFFNEMNLNLLLIGAFLLFKTYTEIFEHSFIFNKFLLERYLYEIKYKRVKNIKDIKRIYKNKYNFINNESEDKILAKIFDNNGYF